MKFKFAYRKDLEIKALEKKISPEKDATFYLNCWQTFADTIFKLSGTVEKLQAENKAFKEKTWFFRSRVGLSR